MSKVQSPIFNKAAISQDLDSGQQVHMSSFIEYLNNPETVLAIPSQEMNSFIWGKGLKYSIEANTLLEEKFAELTKDFTRRILVRGLYAAADSAQTAFLTSEQDDVRVSSRQSMDRITTTISKGKADTPDWDQVTFQCSEDDPTNVGMVACCGTFQTLAELVDTAARRFADPKKGFSVMQPEKKSIGGPKV